MDTEVRKLIEEAFEYYYDPLNANYNDKFVPELFRI